MPQARAHLVEKKTENQLVDVDKLFKFDLHAGTRLTFSISFGVVIAVSRPQPLFR